MNGFDLFHSVSGRQAHPGPLQRWTLLPYIDGGFFFFLAELADRVYRFPLEKMCRKEAMTRGFLADQVQFGPCLADKHQPTLCWFFFNLILKFSLTHVQFSCLNNWLKRI